MAVLQLIDTFTHYLEESSLFNGERFLVRSSFVKIENKHFGHVAWAEHFFYVRLERKVTHLSV